jgi:ribonuclease E
MSRQRIRTSVLESSTDKCPHCGGTGHVRSVSSVALQLLRGIEETLQRGATHNIVSRTRSEIALYVLNHKRAHLYDLEHRFQIAVTIASDDAISGQLPFVIEKGEQVHTMEQARALAAQASAHAPVPMEEAFEAEQPVEEAEFEEADEEEIAEAEAAEHDEAAEGRADDGRRRRRRRRRGRRGETREEGVGIAAAPEGEGEPTEEEHHPAQEQPPYHAPHAPALEEEVVAVEAAVGEMEADLGDEDAEARADQGDGRRRRRRGRRGGRRNRREEGEFGISSPENGVAPIDEEVAHAVADFGGPPAELTTEQTWDQQPREPEHAEHAVAERRPQERHSQERHAQEHRAHEAPQPEPVAAEPAVAPKPDKSESPRRRSTVREPAPFLVSGGSAAPSAPAPHQAAAEIISAEAEPAAPPAAASEPVPQPRRAGWWAKRMLGDKG